MLENARNDSSSKVRVIAATRSSANQVREMMRKFPNDRILRKICDRQCLAEGLAAPTVVDEPFDMYGKKRLGDAVKQDKGPELSDRWYKDKAFKLLQDFGGNIEYTWEETAVKTFVNSLKATSGVEVDSDKLLKALKDLIESIDDESLGECKINESFARSRLEELEEFVETPDPVRDLVESKCSAAEYLTRANELFQVRESTVPSGIRKYRSGGDPLQVGMIPVVCRMPHGGVPRALDERAMDAYCTHWNAVQSLRGEPLVVEWRNHPESVDKVSFSVVLK
jgi:hypothetical protein